MRKNIIISLMLGVIVSTVAFYFAFKNVPFDDLLSYVKSINYLWILPSIAVALISFILRAFRWQVILSTVREINFWRAFNPMMIGFMINCIFPGRAGELARPIILKKKDNVPFTTGLATVAAERMFDVSLLITFFTVVLAFVRIDPDLNITYGTYHLNREILEAVGRGMLKLCLVLIAGIIMISIAKIREIIIRLIINKIPMLFFGSSSVFKSKIRDKVCMPLVRVVENFAAGFSLVRHPQKIAICVGLSFFVWGLSALSYYFMALGCPGIDLSFLEISAVMIIICFFIALPSVPGFWGIWEAGGVFALSIFGVSSKAAAGMTLVNHAIQMFPVIIVGFISAIVTGVNIWRVTYEREE
ncbi:lysylphosphatidylglycerol synthase transmembrane domain-containing protein [Thermodesulfobacteriota bacterium]